MCLLTIAFRYSLNGGRIAIIGCVITLSLLAGCSPYSKEFRNGSNYAMHGNNDQAIMEFDRAIEKNSDDSVAYYSRGCTYFKKQQFDKAIADLDKFLELAKLHNASNVPDAPGGSSAYGDYLKMTEMSRAANIGVRSGLGFAGVPGPLGFGWGGKSSAKKAQEDLEKSLIRTAVGIRTGASSRKAEVYEEKDQIPEALATYEEYIVFYENLEPNLREQNYAKDMYRQSVEKVAKLKAKTKPHAHQN